MNRQTNEAILNNFVNAEWHLCLALASLNAAAERMDNQQDSDEHSDLIGLVRAAIRLNAAEMRQWKRELDTH